MASQLGHLKAWVGEWKTKAATRCSPTRWRPAGSRRVAEGEKFLYTARTTITPTSDSISVIGDTKEGADSLTMLSFDSRGVFRVYGLSGEEGELKIWRDDPGFRQRLTGRFSDDGNTFGGTVELNEYEAGWNDDRKITYRRPGG
jgi:hypothetical protein